MATAVPITDADFENLLRLEAARDAADGWHASKRTDGCEVWVQKHKDQPMHLVKAFLEFPGIKKDILVDLFREPELKRRYDLALNTMEVIEERDDHQYVYGVFNIPIIGVSKRDAVTVQKTRTTADETIVVIKNATHSERPERPGYIRAQFLTGGCIAREKPGHPDTGLMTFFIHNDLRGHIPTTALNAKAVSRPEALRKNILEFYKKTYKAELEAAS